MTNKTFTDRHSEKQHATDTISELIDAFQKDERDPDHWERVHVAAAISAVLSGLYGLAVAECWNALTPPSFRSTAHLPTDEIYDRLNTGRLREILDKVVALPPTEAAIFW